MRVQKGKEAKGSTHQALHRRTVAEMQVKVIASGEIQKFLPFLLRHLRKEKEKAGRTEGTV